jgi:hypothetical protein
MHRSLVSRHRLAVGLMALAAIVAACGGNSPSAPAATSGAPASAGAASSADPAASQAGQLLDIAIAQPYTLVDLAASKADAIQAGIEKDLGAYAKAVHVSIKTVQQGGGTAAGYLMVVAFPRGTLCDEVYRLVISDLSMGSETDYPSKLIGAVPVSFGSMSGGSVAVFRTGDLVFITLATQTTDLTPVVTALVKANG